MSDLLNVKALCLSCLILVLTATSTAQELPSRNTWDLSVWFAGATGEEHTDSFAEAQIYTAGVFVGRTIIRELGSGWRRGSLEYGFDVVPLFVASGTHGLHGVGFDPVIVRWNSGHSFVRLSPYVELGGGGLATNSNFPAGDTSSFNFMARGGGGFNIFAGERHAIDLGCRWWHISNANLGARNPEFNGVQFSIGFHWLK